MEIRTPVIHDRHLVKRAFEVLKSQTEPGIFTHPKDLTILTCRNEGSLEDRIIDSLVGYDKISILEVNTEYLGLDLVVLTDDRLPWRNTFKFELINDYLQSGKCTTEYFMFCDAVDVIFVDHPNKVIDIFKSFECEALFMSTSSLDGYNCMPEVLDWVHNTNGNITRYLNSGVYIGKTSFVKELFEESMQYALPHGVIMDEYRDYLATEPKDYPHGSQDQDIIRYLEPKFYPRMKVDYENQMAFRS
jgi:hypothetical protein